jgi:hypothetical protein
VDIDPQVLLCLVAVQQLGGGQPVPTKQDLFTKGLKTPLQVAQEKGWLRSDKADVSTVGKTGKAKVTKQDVLLLTEEGQRILHQAGSPETLAAVAAGEMQALRAKLEADRQTLRQEVITALGQKTKAKADPAAKEMTALSKIVADLAKRLEKIEANLNTTGPDPLLQRIDQAFARLEEQLGKTSLVTPKSPGPNPATQQTPSLRQTLKAANDDLRLLVDFEDGLVPLPRLYHQAKTAVPGLTVETFHQELEKLWNERQLELQVLNEVRTASEPDKALRRGDDLYYYVIWR